MDTAKLVMTTSDSERSTDQYLVSFCYAVYEDTPVLLQHVLRQDNGELEAFIIEPGELVKIGKYVDVDKVQYIARNDDNDKHLGIAE